MGRLVVLAVITWPVAAVSPVRAADDQGHELFKVDLGCPREATTFKDGWTRWWLNGGCEGDALGSLLFQNIADSGIDDDRFRERDWVCVRRGACADASGFCGGPRVLSVS